MTQPEIPALQEDLRQAEEGLYLAERLKKASMTNEEDLEECINRILQSPEKRTAVLAELDLDAELLLLKSIEEAKAVEVGNAEPSPIRRRAWKRWSVVVAVIVGTPLSVLALNHWYVRSEVAPTVSRVGQVAVSDVIEFRDEPLVRVAARYNQRNSGRRFVIQGTACRFPVNAVLNLKKPSSFIVFIRSEPKLKTYGDKVIYVRDVGDPWPGPCD